jgi:hypothetical protein
MTLYDTITTTYSELLNADLLSLGIWLQDDSDGLGAYIAAWNYTKPIPDGLKLGK